MADKKKNNRTFEFRLRVDGREVSGAPTSPSASLDRLLKTRKAASFVFLPLAKPSKNRPRVERAAARARRKSELKDHDWISGDLHVSDLKQPIPGVLAFDVRRRRAREIAQSMGVELFFWGATGAPVEKHTVEAGDDESHYEWKTMKRRAFAGLRDLFEALRNIAELPQAIIESQSSMGRFRRLVYVVLGVAATGGLLHGVAVEWIGTIANVILYPVVLPALIVGVHLRLLAHKGEAQARDFTAQEAAANWRLVAPHLLALWGLCFVAVTLLTWFQSVPHTEMGIFGSTAGLTNSFIVCVWMLLPIASSNDFERLFSSAFEAAITAVISIIVIRVSLYITDMITDAAWGALAAILPFTIPDKLMRVIDFFVDIGAELFLLGILLGYAWSRTREQFMRL